MDGRENQLSSSHGLTQLSTKIFQIPEHQIVELCMAEIREECASHRVHHGSEICERVLRPVTPATDLPHPDSDSSREGEVLLLLLLPWLLWTVLWLQLCSKQVCRDVLRRTRRGRRSECLGSHGGGGGDGCFMDFDEFRSTHRTLEILRFLCGRDMEFLPTYMAPPGCQRFSLRPFRSWSSEGGRRSFRGHRTDDGRFRASETEVSCGSDRQGMNFQSMGGGMRREEGRGRRDGWMDRGKEDSKLSRNFAFAFSFCLLNNFISVIFFKGKREKNITAGKRRTGRRRT